MAGRNSPSLAKNVAAFCANPSSFLSNVTAESFLDDLLKELKNESVSEQTKVSILNVFLEFPEHLCPEKAAGELTAEILLNILQHTSVKSITLRCHLLLAIETVLITTDNFSCNCRIAQDFASLLMHLISDINDKKQGSSNRPVRVTACECLRELEHCYPGLLSQRLELLYTMQHQELTSAHQSYTLLYSVTLKNAVQILAQKEGPSDGTLKQMLSSNDSFAWNVTKDMKELQSSSGEQLFLLPSNNETKELKSILALLLEDSYLFTAACQNTLFWQIIQIVAMVRTISPIVFKSQLVRLFGTKDISCFHSILLMKAVFTDSLFTAEDEHFLLQRLVGMTQHPLLSTPVKLFYLDCLLHFPENRPLNSNPGENLPVLLTVQMTSSLFPNIFNDSMTMLCRQNLLSMVYLENEGYRSERGIGYLFEHLMALYSMVDTNADREITATFFRSVYLFVQYFNLYDMHMENLTKTLLELYKSQSSLALYFINLINQTQNLLEFQPWPVLLAKGLQKHIVNLPMGNSTMKFLRWHLKVLSRVAQENTISQTSTVLFLRRLVLESNLCHNGDWGLGNALLSVCRNILQHEHLSVDFMHLADLLQHLINHYEDIDIQERARLYSVFLANVSSDKLEKLLNMSPMGGPMKTRTLSSIMTESEHFSSLLTIHNTEKIILCLRPIHDEESALVTWTEHSKEESPSANYDPTGKSPPGQRNPTEKSRSGGHDPTEKSPSAKYSLKEYYQYLKDNISSLLALKFHLTLNGDVEEKYHKLTCIVLQFDLTDANYEQISDIDVKCLFAHRKPPVVSIPIVPKEPCPSILGVNATFNTEDGCTYLSRLEPLHISFPELFVPLPVPVTYPSDARYHLFVSLWQNMQPDDQNLCEESIFSHKMSEKSLRDFVRAHFSKFVVSHCDTEYKIAILLPPKYHILIRARFHEDMACFDIRTDNWRMLPYLNSHLRDLSQKT